MYYLKNLNMICFDLEELSRIYERSKKKEIAKAVSQSGLTSLEIYADTQKMSEIVDQAISKGLKNKDEAEIFMSLLYAPHFYGNDCKVCFVLKPSVNPDKIKIDYISDLICLVKENDLTDFAIKSEDGVRQFQLKRIKFPPTTQSLFEFLKEKIAHYSNDLGNVNMLLALQGSGDITEDIFNELNIRLKELNFKTQAEILISYNEENKDYVMNQIYPDVRTTRVPIKNLL